MMMNRLGGDTTTTTPKQQQIRKIQSHKSSSQITTGSPLIQAPPQPNPLRLLIDKFVFLDVNTSYKHLGKLKECLITIGVNLADCLSKDVNYVITNRVKYEDLKVTSSFSSDAICDLSKTPKKTSPTVSSFSRCGAINRTQAILEKASKGNMCTDVLTSARRLGISIMHVIEIEKYVEKYMMKTKLLTNNPNKVNILNTNTNESQMKQQKESYLIEAISESITGHNNNNLKKLKSPYIKFESICKQYKPNYHEFKQWHDILLDLNVKNNHSPFQIYFSEEIKTGDGSSTSSTHNQNEASTKTAKNTPVSTQTTTTTINAFAVEVNSATKGCSYLSSILDTQGSQQPSTTKTPLFRRTNSTISNASSIHHSLNRTSTAPSVKQLIVPAKSPANRQKKVGGYCECCKLRYDNLKQHLTSLQHETFEKNHLNFKELDAYIGETLNYEKFISKYKNEKKFDDELKEKETTEDVNEKTLIEDDEIKQQQKTSPPSSTKKQPKMLKDIDRLIFESQSLGVKKGERRRSNAIMKYTELTNKDFNVLLTATTPTKTISMPQVAAAAVATPKSLVKCKKSLTVPSDLNLITSASKSTKRKRQVQEGDESKTAATASKPKIKLKLERNKSNNNWQVSSASSALYDENEIIMKNEIDKQFDNALLELVKECENERETAEQQQQQTPIIVEEENNKSKRPKILTTTTTVVVEQPRKSKAAPKRAKTPKITSVASSIHAPLPSFQTTFIPQAPPPPKQLFTPQQLNSLNSQILAAQQLSSFCIYMAPSPPLPPILPALYHPTPFYMPPPHHNNSVLNKYTENQYLQKQSNYPHKF